MGKAKIVLDADVLIHFSKAERLSLLPEILPEYEYIVYCISKYTAVEFGLHCSVFEISLQCIIFCPDICDAYDRNGR